MSRIIYAPLCAATMALAACGGSGGGTSAPPAPPNSLTQLNGGTATSSRAEVSRHENGFILRIKDGPLKDTSVVCEDIRGQNCTVLGDPALITGQTAVLGQLQGQHAFAANVSIAAAEGGNFTQSVHAPALNRDPAQTVLPQGILTHNGRFQAGAGLDNGPEGLIAGTVRLDIDFDTGRINGRFNGGFPDQGPAIAATFTGATIDSRTGHFASTDTTRFTFQNSPGGGDLEGAFYGPKAEESAGAFTIGAQNIGGMSGVFLTCQGPEATCITP